MKILIVCSGNVDNFKFEIHHAFVHEQIEKVKEEFENIEYETFFIRGKGAIGYLNNLKKLKKKIEDYSPDFIHAHFGLSGLLSCLQRKVPVVITFHGSDANIPTSKFFSRIAARLSYFNIFVSDQIQKNIKKNNKSSIIPCGINLETFYPVEMRIARDKLNMDQDKKYILFASSFSNTVKNAVLAFSAIGLLQCGVELIELKDKSRSQVNLLLNSCNILLLTSISEGSPQVIKEAMACNRPIVATDVGDIKEVIGETKGCYITTFNPSDVAEKISLALSYSETSNGRNMIKRFDNKLIAQDVYKIYKNIVERKDDNNS